MSRKKTSQEIYNSLRFLVTAKNSEQQLMIDTIAENVITFVKGAAGTGKTFLAVNEALTGLLSGEYHKVVFTRPVVEAGEKLGFLPGNIHNKIDPYMIPIFDAVDKLMHRELSEKLIARNRNNREQISILPLAFMRGITFQNCFVVADESQNTTREQMRMLVTRIGHNSKMIICGDVEQSDINNSRNGLSHAFENLQGVNQVGFVTLSEQASVRHPIIIDLEKRYNQRGKE